MLQKFKIFFIVLGLSLFILPKQTTSAQDTAKVCTQNSYKDDCCKTEKSGSCHSEKSPKKNSCNDNCSKCHSCSLPLSINFFSAQSVTLSTPAYYAQKLTFEYTNSYFSSSFQNIWQPPKIS